MRGSEIPHAGEGQRQKGNIGIEDMLRSGALVPSKSHCRKIRRADLQ